MSSLTQIFRLGQRSLCRRHAQSKNMVRKMGGGRWLYREEVGDTPKRHFDYAMVIGFIAVSFSGYMTYNHFGHIVGDFPYIDPSQWTDEELGIPPDDEDIYPAGYVPLAQRT